MPLPHIYILLIEHMGIIARYICYIRDIRRYSERTVTLYGDVIADFVSCVGEGNDMTDKEIVEAMKVPVLRDYVVEMVERDLSAKTVSLHMSVLSGFCRFLMMNDLLASNPVKLISKPKVEKRLPVFYRKEAMAEYFSKTSWLLERDEFDFLLNNINTESGKEQYGSFLGRLIISMLYSLGLRRAELIGLTVGDIDFGRKVVKVRGKGDKMREIPLIVSLSEEILLYLEAVEALCGGKRSLKEPLLVTYMGKKLYPMFVDRAVKKELGAQNGITGRKSPHVLRHSLATGLMDENTNINSIKELLGHSSLATTQVYTHSSVARLKEIYKQAHPRAKNGGKHGD